MATSTLWEKVKTGSKTGFDKAWKAADKLGAPVNRLSNRLGSEAFWPTTMDKESDKAARILQSFCKDGFYAEQDIPSLDGPKMKQRVVKKIPAKVIQNAKGLAIFTTMRTGLWVSGAGGSGVLVARKADGTWSPPSGILLHTAGLGFMVGVDIYDCVLVLNTHAAVEAFTKVRCTLGGEVSVVAGPVGAGGILETELHKRQAPIFTYMKSRGFYAGVQIDGTVIIERNDENEAFYRERLGVKEIISGSVRHPPYELKMLMETLKAAQGDMEFDASALPSEPPPGDYVVDDGHTFGVPDKEDPDPYGVLALEKEGLSLKEAGTHKRASWEEFNFNPVPSSPVHSVYARRQSRQSDDRSRRPSLNSRSSWRASAFANHEPKSPSSLRNSMDVTSISQVQMVETATQTEDSSSPQRTSRVNSYVGSLNGSNHVQMQDVPEHEVLKELEPASASKVNGISTPPTTPPLESKEFGPHDAGAELEDDDLEDEHEAHIIEAPVVHSIQSVKPTTAAVINKARLVSVPKRGPPPALPPRNPGRRSPLDVDASSLKKRFFDSSVETPTEGEEHLPSFSDISTATSHDELKRNVDMSPVETSTETANPQSINEKFDDVKLDEEEKPRGPWAKVDETRKDANASPTKMPGGFD